MRVCTKGRKTGWLFEEWDSCSGGEVELFNRNCQEQVADWSLFSRTQWEMVSWGFLCTNQDTLALSPGSKEDRSKDAKSCAAVINQSAINPPLCGLGSHSVCE